MARFGGLAQEETIAGSMEQSGTLFDRGVSLQPESTRFICRIICCISASQFGRRFAAFLERVCPQRLTSVHRPNGDRCSAAICERVVGTRPGR